MRVEPDRAEYEHLVCSFACFDLLGLILYVPINNLLVLSEWVYLGGCSTKQQVKCLFALIFFIPVGSGRSLILLRCLALGHNTVTLTSVSLELANLQLSHCALHSHQRLKQTLSLLDSLLLINKKRHADNNYLHVLILKRNVSLRRFF